MNLIDAHIHFWSPERHPDILTFERYPDMRRTFGPDNYINDIRGLNIDGGILVQSEPSGRHSDDCAIIAANSPIVKCSVGWLDTDTEIDLESLKLFRNDHHGFRLMLNRMSEAQLSSSRLEHICVLAGASDLSVELLGREQLSEVMLRLAKAAPDTRFVVDHCLAPDTSHAPSQDWRERISALGRQPNIANKLGGLIENSNDDNKHIPEYLLEVFDAFSDERLMFASNWPISERFGGILRWLSQLDEFLAQQTVSATAKANIFGNTARSFFAFV